MTCLACVEVKERKDVPHVIRLCSGCGRELHIVEPGERGRGINIQAGDRFVIPAGWIKLSLNPLEATGHLFRPGIEMLAAGMFLADLHRSEEGYTEAAAKLERLTDSIVNSFPPLKGLDINNPVDGGKILEIMEGHRATTEFWALWTGQFLAVARNAVVEGNAIRAAWATACAERCRAMMLFKQSLEDVVFMGHSVKRILQILRTWDANKENSSEDFWQITFTENSYVLSQVFAVPMVFLQDKAYVGGMTLDRSDARFVDYLFSAESSREAILVEIKTPTTPLLASEYRGNRPPSRDLGGSVVQVLNYRAELSRNLRSIVDKDDLRLSAFSPRCAIIIGNAHTELTDEVARRSFELYRTGLKDVEIITYDEIFRKMEILAELFGLKRTTSKPA